MFTNFYQEGLYSHQVSLPVQYMYPYYPVYQQPPHYYRSSTQESIPVQRPIIIHEEPSFKFREDIPAVQQSAPVVLVNSWATRNANFRSRCGCSSIGTCSSLNRGTSYVAVDYNYGVGPGKYDIRVWIKHYGKEHYGKHSTFERRWSSFINAPDSYNHFTTSKLTGPGSPGREGYFQNDNNDTPGLQTGTLGLAVYKKGTDEIVWRALYYFDNGFGNWGREWLRCGHDYGFQFRDA